MASSVSTDETTNYARLCRLLVDKGSKALRDTFDGIHPPADLHKVLTQPPHNATLNTLKTKKIINSSQWGDLFPAVQSSVSSKRFDVTLLMVLLRNICRLAQPATGWDNLPPDSDKSKEANIARIKYYRNTVYGHASQASVDYATFNSCWTAISNAITGLVGEKYEADMENLRVGSMDPVSEEHYKKLLREWKKDEDSVKERLEEIDENVRKGLEQIKGDMGKELEQIKGDMGKGLEQIKGDMGNIGEKLENFMYRTEEMEDEEPRAGNNVNNFDVQVYVSLPITTAMPPNPGLQPRKDLEFFGHDYPGQVIHQVQNLPGSPRLSLSSQNEDNTRQHENQRCENKDSPPVNGTSASTDVESPGYDYPSLVAVTQPPQHRPPLPSLPIENEEDTYYLSLKWQNEDPLPGNGIFVSTGDSDEANSFLENVEQAIKEFDSMNGTTKDEREQCILQLVLPNLEEKWKKSSTNRRKIYIDLVQIGCSRTSPNTVRHSLRQLLRLMLLDNLESGDYNLLGLESIIRLSISSPDAVFKEEGHQERLLRLSVYSQTLALLIIQKCQKWLSSDDITRELLQLRGHLGKSYNQTKDLFHYSMEFITQAIRFLAQKRKKFEKSDVMAFLKECKESFDPHYAGNGELTFIQILKSPKSNKRKWFALHCVIWYLYFKTYNEDTNHRLQTDRQSVLLLRSVIEAYSVGDGKKRSGNDWKFFVLAGSVLSDITMNNINRENRIDACTCLLNLVKKGVWRGILEPLSRQVLLSPDSYVRSLMADALCTEDNSCCAITEGHHIDHLVTKFPALEVNNEIISRSDRCFVIKAVFSGREAVLKVMYVTNQNVRGRMPSDCQQANLRFIREAYFLSRIQRHPNFPILLSYNTETLPYHLITEYESQGNLLQLLQRAHDQHSRLEENLLLQMLINIADALRYLEKLHLVHRSVMAKNVLVGDDNVCRLSGLHSLRPTDWGPLTEAEDVNDDLPLKWKAPECLLEHHYSTASDVWAFGVVMYEVLTLGYSPFGNLSDKDVYNYVTMGGTPPLGAYFEDNENNLMKQCWERKRSERISFPKLSSRLKKMNAELKTAGVARRKSRPDLQPSLANPKVTAEREDDASYTMRKESSRVVEKITAKDILYHEPLKKLSHPNISISLFWTKSSPEIEIISMRCDLGNLKDYVISGRKGGSCERGDLFIFLSQVASALNYLHTEHIVHGNLRAEHVNVVSSKQVQITHLGRSKRLSTRPDEETSKGCWEKAYMPPDSTRWRAPEVISKGRYSHASDAWSFGVLAWELFAAFSFSENFTERMLPHHNLPDHEVTSCTVFLNTAGE
ncbi:Tyrosine-protein kinase transforming protein Fes [Stylophora pistillata]|uniref:Tyrosine-protein kinase transforming protein Fes n=1 Tax=Stylophora pistillata TaxID=50429 RepID=A0A2B4RF59_STYPI|nr:Tyrosine-protein kinase transforming protein Fes [Stylophora pistillata]